MPRVVLVNHAIMGEIEPLAGEVFDDIVGIVGDAFAFAAIDNER